MRFSFFHFRAYLLWRKSFTAFELLECAVYPCCDLALLILPTHAKIGRAAFPVTIVYKL
jgi:hypothetical protein